jgi:hypothetical protein
MATGLDHPLELSSVNRAEERIDTVRIVEYSEFPHRVSKRSARVGFTRDISGSGLCVGAERPERVGSMLRLGIRALDGGPTDSRIGRVAWTSETLDGRHWIGIKLLTEASLTDATVLFDRSRNESPGRLRRYA